MSINGLGSQFQPAPGFGATTYLHAPGVFTEYASHPGGFSLTNVNAPVGNLGPVQGPSFGPGLGPQQNLGGFGFPAGPAAPPVAPFMQQQPVQQLAAMPPAFMGQPPPQPSFLNPQPMPMPGYGHPPMQPQPDLGGLIHSIIAPMMQMMTMMIGMMLDFGSFIGPGFPGDIHHEGPHGEVPMETDVIMEEEIIEMDDHHHMEDDDMMGDHHMM